MPLGIDSFAIQQFDLGPQSLGQTNPPGPRLVLGLVLKELNACRARAVVDLDGVLDDGPGVVRGLVSGTKGKQGNGSAVGHLFVDSGLIICRFRLLVSSCLAFGFSAISAQPQAGPKSR